jgi:DNA-binding response OmpR family regulator
MIPTDRRVLYVDDSHDACEMMRAWLRHNCAGLEVSTAQSAEEAVSLLNQEDFDLYILDMQLPGTSGAELCRLIRSHDVRSPVIFSTAMAGTADRESVAAAGANAFLIKPNDLEVLPETIETLLGVDCSGPAVRAVG